MKKNFLFLTFEPNLATRFLPLIPKKLTDPQKFRNLTLRTQKNIPEIFSRLFLQKKRRKKNLKKVDRNKNQNQTHSCSSLHRGLNRWHYPKKTPPPQKFEGKRDSSLDDVQGILIVACGFIILFFFSLFLDSLCFLRSNFGRRKNVSLVHRWVVGKKTIL